MDRKIQMAVYAYRNTELYRDKWSNHVSVSEIAELGKWEAVPCIEKKDKC